MATEEVRVKKPWRCKLFGHDYRDVLFGWPIPDLVLGGSPEKTIYECRRCHHRTRIKFKPATRGLGF